MKISYNWLKEFIPGIPEPQSLSNILTAVGLEVENIEHFEEIKGSLKGLVAGEILKCEQHPEADKLKVTEVDTGNGNILQIICGATNAGARQKVVVAPVDSTIYPFTGEPITLKKVKIRGIESDGMICAEDEIGISGNHEGIIILPDNIVTGSRVADYFKPGNDWIFEIGLTPNRIDAMSHIGVAKDVRAWLSHHTKKTTPILSAFNKEFKADKNSLPISIIIENTQACERYTGVSIANIKIESSPKWMQLKLKSIGVRPINNIVDVTNYILHETGQPLHAFDLGAIKENKIIVKNLPDKTTFVTLDEKERKLHPEDLMICNGLNEPMCFGGVFGGLESGVKNSTTQILLESAWFNPSVIRRTSLRHNLRTDAATRFEKGVDISKTAEVLKRAAMLIKELTGGEITSEIIDVYPNPKPKTSITLQNAYLKKITGKDYKRNEVMNILKTLDFQVEKDDSNSLTIAVPFSKPDVTLPADVIEEIMRIDGFDNVEIPSVITISPALESNITGSAYKENIAHYLTGSGFSEIFTNSITNSKYYDDAVLVNSVKILNSLSSDLDIMRPSIMETGLESIVYNLNRKNTDLQFFEFGNTYSTSGAGYYDESQHLSLFISGNKNNFSWKEKPMKSDFYFLKGVCQNIFGLCGLSDPEYAISKENNLEFCLTVSVNGEAMGNLGIINKGVLQKFDIKQPVLFGDLSWENILKASKKATAYIEIPKVPAVHRDLSMVVNKNTAYSQVESIIKNLSINKLKSIKLFDVFESEKLGPDKKAFAISLTFIDTERTLTDKEIDKWINRIIESFKIELNAEIRK
ncbi:MAG: phenylalanine--tRNA ligase subunit beta [Ginsengibacter sp.]